MLYERTEDVAMLVHALDDARSGRGRLVLLAGEAGVGKTSLVRALVAQARGHLVAVGSCEPSLTPAPLGPLFDIAAAWGGSLEAAVHTRGDRPDLFRTVLDELRMSSAAVMVLEDVHWADQATLELLRYLGRRVARTHGLVLATYRDDETGATHPLRQILGELANSEGVIRMRLRPLSRTAVSEMAAGRGVDAEALFQRTGGNPFFVTETLNSPDDFVPETVRDAVLARAARLSEGCRRVLGAAAIVPARIELELLRRLADAAGEDVDTCVEVGMLLDAGDGAVAFRHELARQALEQSLPPARRTALHERAAGALATSGADSARIAYHAAAAMNVPLASEHAIRAGRRASQLGAHRQAVAQYAVALRFADHLEPWARAELQEAYAEEAMSIGSADEGLGAAEEAVALRRSAPDPAALSRALLLLSRAQWQAGLSRAAEETVQEVVGILEPLGPSAALANAEASRAAYAMLARDLPEALEHGERAISLAQEVGADWALARGLNALGSIKILNNVAGGRDDLERQIKVAEAAGLPALVNLGYSNLGSAAGEVRDYATAEPALREAVRRASDEDMDAQAHYAGSWLARVLFEQGRWDEAETVIATLPVDRPGASPAFALTALTVLGRLRARRGDNDAMGPLQRAWRLAVDTGDLQRLWPVAAARAEHAWLQGARDDVPDMIGHVLALARRARHPWATGELALLLHRAGVLNDVPEAIPEPYRLHLDGDLAAAAEAWRRIGCPYEQADTLSDADDETSLREGLAVLHQLGAAPAAARIRRRLRELGASRIPRGPRASTAANAAGLTARQIAVLELVARGLSDAQIAETLFISRKTAGHHISAILSKLGVSSRGRAAQIAREDLLASQHGEPPTAT